MLHISQLQCTSTDHVAVARLWELALRETRLDPKEHQHMLGCETCWKALRVCLFAAYDSHEGAKRLKAYKLIP
jgi:hypothetical protein